jgi:hypothetical protein
LPVTEYIKAQPQISLIFQQCLLGVLQPGGALDDFCREIELEVPVKHISALDRWKLAIYIAA